MKRLALLGIIVTCVADADHNLYVNYQVNGVISYDEASLQLKDDKGDYYEIYQAPCVISEGVIVPPGDDERMTQPPKCLQEGSK